MNSIVDNIYLLPRFTFHVDSYLCSHTVQHFFSFPDADFHTYPAQKVKLNSFFWAEVDWISKIWLLIFFFLLSKTISKRSNSYLLFIPD